MFVGQTQIIRLMCHQEAHSKFKHHQTALMTYWHYTENTVSHLNSTNQIIIVHELFSCILNVKQLNMWATQMFSVLWDNFTSKLVCHCKRLKNVKVYEKKTETIRKLFKDSSNRKTHWKKHWLLVLYVINIRYLNVMLSHFLKYYKIT